MYLIVSLKYYCLTYWNQNLPRLNLPKCGWQDLLSKSHCSGMPVGPFPLPGISHDWSISIFGTPFLFASCWFRAKHDSFLASEICAQGYWGHWVRFSFLIKRGKGIILFLFSKALVFVCGGEVGGGAEMGTVFLGTLTTIIYPLKKSQN